jgi:hypothetical protein
MTDKSANMMVPQVHVSDGLSQAVRKLPALQKNYFNVDERRFEQLLAQVQDYARLVKMPGMDHKNITAANQLFADDEAVVMAYILAQDINQLDRQFELRMQQELANSDWALQDWKGASPLGLASLLDTWLLLLRYPQTSAGEQLYSMIESVIIGFGKEFYPLLLKLPRLQAIAPELFSPQFLELTKQEQLRLESLGLDSPAAETAADPQAQETSPRFDEYDLRNIYAALIKSIDMVQEAARELLPASLTGEFHDPAAALRIVFVLLFKKLQDKLNRFTLNYFDFYFNRVLQVQLLPMRPDSLYLVLQPTSAQSLVLPRGTEFVAGLDVNRQDIVYRSDADVEINDAKVEQLHNVYFPSHERFEDNTRRLIDGCWHTSIATDNAGPEFYPLFGEQRGQVRVNAAQDARLGFAIASNVLLMREGKRRVSLQLHYVNLINDSCATLEHQINDMPPLKASKADRSTRTKAKFFAYFGNIFNLAITTAEGWYEIPEYKPAYHGTDSALKRNCLGVSFYLPEDCPPIAPFNREIHGAHLQSASVPTAVPVLRFLLKDNYLQYPYDLLRKLALREIRIDVAVEGCRDLLLYNNLGQLSPLAPFMPFGPLPGIGSYFVVGHEETRTKQLSAFSLDIEWAGLPDVGNGFNEWYRGYLSPKTNDNFVVSPSVLADGKWQPGEMRGKLRQPLFATAIKNGQVYLQAHKRLTAGPVIPWYKPQEGQQARRPFAYTPATKAGLFKFMLQGPLGGFGHLEYQHLLTNTLSYNARVKHEQLYKPMPNPPYTPEIASISLNYEATAVINMADSDRLQNAEFKDQFFHLHPLGWELMSPLRQSRIFQVPQYAHAGNLFIGLSASEMGHLNLLFHFHNDSLPMEQAAPSSSEEKYFDKAGKARRFISWSYLSDNQWRELSPKQILADSTQGFMRTGIVTLSLPTDMTSDNTVMPAGLYWLCVSADEQLRNYSHLYTIYAQAVSATWNSGEHPPSNPPMVLAAGSIQRARQNLPGIAGVRQICDSFGGVPRETPELMRARTSERLRHKNRALTPRDIEALVLQQFPQVYKVKCFANINTRSANPICPGHLLVVPVPHVNPTQPHYFQLHFDGYLIQCIKDYVQQLASPFAQISVENPTYEEIQVRCRVQFKKSIHSGRYHNLLNQALCDYLSPWAPEGNQVHFGWNIGARDVQSFIRNLDYVDFLTDFSLLRIARHKDGSYFRDDTAANPEAEVDRLMPSYYWSTAVPLPSHFIVTARNKDIFTAEVTGYDELEIGSTFIIS